MKISKWTASILSVALIASAYTFAADDAKPAAAKDDAADVKSGEKMKKPAKLVKPWSQLTSLSEEQQTQIRDIHKKALDEINAIEAKEKQDIMAVLNDAQKAELKAMMESDAAARKSKMKKDAPADGAAKDGEKPAK